MTLPDRRTRVRERMEMILLLRWLLIVATSYVVLFSRLATETPPHAALFVGAYVASNLLLTLLLSRPRWPRGVDAMVVLFDAAAVSVGLFLTGGTASEFFVVYFVVVFLATLTERLALVVGAAAMLGAAHLYTVSRFADLGQLAAEGYLLRLPFLLAVALFCAHLVASVRRRVGDGEQVQAAENGDCRSTVSPDPKPLLGMMQSVSSALLTGAVGPLSERQADLVRCLQDGVRQLAAASPVDAEQTETERLGLKRTSASLADVVEGVLGVARHAAEVKGIALQCAFEEEIPAVRIDVQQMEQLVSSLLGNAIKYTPPGGTVRVTLERRTNRVVMAVRDDGPGIVAEALHSLFEKPACEAGGNGGNGSGHGLFTIKAIVEAHGGAVEMSNTAGHGTTVTIHLPAEPEPQPAWAATLAAARPPADPGWNENSCAPADAGAPGPIRHPFP